jgi:signal transduction histidine kinase
MIERRERERRERDIGLRRLMNVGRRLVAELDPEVVLERLLEEARNATGARYAALGVLNEDRTELGRFLHLGVDDETARAIGSLPRGRGVLGVLIETPEPLRLAEVGSHEQSFGFPVGHPEMRSFLGVPIMIGGEAWGNLYLAEKTDGEAFTSADEDAASVLAEWAGTAIVNARMYGASERRRQELERAVLGLDAARNIADAIGTESDLDRILELTVKRGRALIRARAVLILLREGDELVVRAAAGEVESAKGRAVPLRDSIAGNVLRAGQSLRLPSEQLRHATSAVGVHEASNSLLVPMAHRGEGIGVLVAFDSGPERGAFSDADEDLVRTFAASAANAVAISHSVEESRLRSTIAAAEAERLRWARELHDETLQSLGGLRVLLSGALRRDDPIATRETVRQAISDIEYEIENLRSIITELRPMLLDDLGLGPAIEALVERRRGSGLEIITTLELPDDDGGTLTPELETTLYRLVQESLTNIIKHARAACVRVEVTVTPTSATARIIDDGAGFDPEQKSSGFGLAGISERVYLASGRLDITSAPGVGTTVSARFPLSGVNLGADEPLADRGLTHDMS